MRTLSPRTRALIGFAALGTFWGPLGAALPALQRRADAGDADLGVALVALAAGALLAMRATGVLMDRFGPALTPLTVAALAVSAALPGLATSPGQLSAALFVVGVTSGAVDVAINADAVREELASGRTLMNLAHAFFSGAVVVASVATGVLRWAGAEPLGVFAAAAVLVLAAAVAMRTGPIRWAPEPGGRPRMFDRVPGWLLALGALGALAFWIENAWQSWGAVYLERSLDAPPLTSSLGPALFAASMTAGRLAVHRLARPGAERQVLVIGAALAASGSAVAAFAPSVWLALAGILVAGAGCSVCAPTILSIGGRAARPQERATIVGSLATVMYVGFLVGPAAVGGIAEATTLRVSLGSVAAIGFLLTLLFGVVRFPPGAAG
ncbi:MAG TPA: MFS transporter [Gaiellaceae bacterium]|jgi:MFS family permease